MSFLLSMTNVTCHADNINFGKICFTIYKFVIYCDNIPMFKFFNGKFLEIIERIIINDS